MEATLTKRNARIGATDEILEAIDPELLEAVRGERGRQRDQIELIASENYEDYMYNLVEAFNPAAVQNVMCTNTISVGWDGRLYDCDFNQMLELTVNHGAPVHIDNFDFKQLANRRIVTGQHCYGCTAGAGSSCGGATA